LGGTPHFDSFGARDAGAAPGNGRTPITHAIRFTAAVTQDAYLWPGRHSASSDTSKDGPPMGARFRLRASFSVARFCRNAEAYCRDAEVLLSPA
jgi:hypothetical protein